MNEKTRYKELSSIYLSSLFDLNGCIKAPELVHEDKPLWRYGYRWKICYVGC